MAEKEESAAIAYIKASMLTWPRTAEEVSYVAAKQQDYLRIKRGPKSPPRSPKSGRKSPDPWDTKIVPMSVVRDEERAKRDAERRAREALLSEEEKERLDAMMAAKREAARLAAEERARQQAIARAEAEAEAHRRALVAAREKAVKEAGDTAAATALKASLISAKELKRTQEACIVRKMELERELSGLEALRVPPFLGSTKKDTLRRQLGDAILARGCSAEEMVGEWDPEEADAMGIADFRASVRRTLPTLQSIPNEVLDEMFTLVLDECVPTCAHVHMCTHICTYACAYMHVHISVHVYVHVYVHVHYGARRVPIHARRTGARRHCSDGAGSGPMHTHACKCALAGSRRG